jgi:hypothetical protein
MEVFIMSPTKCFCSDISFDFPQIFWEACSPVALSDKLPEPSANPSDDAVPRTHHTALKKKKKIYIYSQYKFEIMS